MKIFEIILICVACAIILFIGVILLNAVRAKSKRRDTSGKRKNVSKEKLEQYTETLSKMIQCKTVFDGKNDEEFVKFQEVLKESFPLLHKRAELKIFGSGCLIYKISGKNATRNIMMMSHHDVVEAEGEWKNPPFSGKVVDGAIWGRGTIDTKTPFFAELQATEELIAEGYDFNGVNLYIGSSNNEEVCGDGMPLAVQFFLENNIKFDVLIDEGGAITQGLMPGVSLKSAMVAVHEKGRHTFLCTANNDDVGHTGLNPSTAKNPISRMSNFIVEVENSKIFKTKFYDEVQGTFVKHTPYMNFPFRLLFANFNLFKGLLKSVMPKVSNQVKSMFGTTMNFTMIEGGVREQIQSKTVTAKAFFRCVRKEDLAKEIVQFKKIADKYNIKVEQSLVDYCEPTSYKQEPFKKLEKILNKNFPDVIVAPFLLTAGSDARHFSQVSDCILRFAPIDLNRQQYGAIHNANENIGVENVGQCVLFYKEFVKDM